MAAAISVIVDVRGADGAGGADVAPRSEQRIEQRMGRLSPDVNDIRGAAGWYGDLGKAERWWIDSI